MARLRFQHLLLRENAASRVHGLMRSVVIDRCGALERFVTYARYELECESSAALTTASWLYAVLFLITTTASPWSIYSRITL